MHDVQTNIHSRNKIIVRSESHLLVQEYVGWWGGPWADTRRYSIEVPKDRTKSYREAIEEAMLQ